MACGRTIRNVGLCLFRSVWRRAHAAAGAVILSIALAAQAAPAPKSTIAVTVSGGYARLVFSASQYIDASARLAGNVLIITFKQPIDVSVDRVAEEAARRPISARRGAIPTVQGHPHGARAERHGQRHGGR